MTETVTNSIVEFWFGSDPQAPLAKSASWWKKDPGFDQLVTDKFGVLVKDGVSGELESWTEKPFSCLAYVLLLDQFTRNMFRDLPDAFSGDGQAREASHKAIANKWDSEHFNLVQRHFLYLPFMHSESLEDQDLCVELDRQLCAEASEMNHEALRKATEGFLDYAIKHRDIIARFGRFPHRNEILGRKSTQEECAFLKQPGSRF